MENMIINRMNLLLLKEAKNLYEGLVLQKNKLNAELANTTYQAFIDKSRIQNGLDQIRDIKVLIEREMKILSQNLMLKRDKVSRLQQRREQSMEEFSILESALQNQKARWNQNADRSARQQQTNKHLATTLLTLQKETGEMLTKRQHIVEKLGKAHQQIQQKAATTQERKRQNVHLQLTIQDLKLKGKTLEGLILDRSSAIDQLGVAIQKCRTNINILNAHSQKVKAINQAIQADNVNMQSKIGEQKKTGSDFQTRLYTSDEQFKKKVVQNRGYLNNNQSLSVSNHHLYEQNKNLSLQFASDNEVLKYLEDINIRLRHLLDEKRIVNNHARSILSAPNKSVIEKGLKREDSINKMMESTGSGFN